MTNQTKTIDQVKKDGIPVVFRSKKAGKEIERDLTSLPYASLLAIAAYGAQRFINDKLGGSEIDPKEAAKTFDKIMEQLEKGWEGRQRGEGTDPVETKARSLAREQVKTAIMAKGLKLKDVGKDKVAELSEKLFTDNKDSYMEQAAELIEAEKAARDKAASAVDLSDLGL